MLKPITLFEDVASLEEALSTGDKHAVRFTGAKRPGGQRQLRRDAKWREAPITATQEGLLRRRLSKPDDNDEDEDGPVVKLQNRSVPLSKLTKGEAANEITRLKNGFKGAVAKVEKDARKREEQELKKKRCRSEVKPVTVGPL
jgi:hypothetical protein